MQTFVLAQNVTEIVVIQSCYLLERKIILICSAKCPIQFTLFIEIVGIVQWEKNIKFYKRNEK